MLLKTKSFFIFILVSFSVVASAQRKSKMDADKLIYNYLEATGGVQQWLNFKTVIFKGRRTYRTQSLPFTIYAKIPDKRRLEVPFKDIEIIQASDGEVSWTINPLMGKGGNEARILKDKDAKLMQDRSEILPEFINYEKRGHQVSYEGEETLDGKSFYKLKVMKKNKEIKYFFFDKNTYLIYLEESITVPQNASVKLFVREYKEVEGLQLPYIVEAVKGGKSIYVIQTEEVIVNPSIDDKIFVFPKH